MKGINRYRISKIKGKDLNNLLFHLKLYNKTWMLPIPNYVNGGIVSRHGPLPFN